MKTSTRKATLKRLEKITIFSMDNKYPLAKQSKVYKMILSIANGETKIRPCTVQGSGRYISNQDHTLALTNNLKKLGIEYILSNDAPRGGLTGNLITITTKIKY
jgi:hypothetical protein